jgi:hypothetical protein
MTFGVTSEILAQLRKEYPRGARVELLKMKDPQAPPIGTRGTVIGVDSIGSIMVRWDNGSGLHVLYKEDACKIVEEMKPEDIEGLVELRAAISARYDYFQQKTIFERGECDFEDVPAYDPRKIPDLKAKYPMAAAYHEAENWTHSFDIERVRLGKQACKRILAGEDYTKVLDEMEASLAAFKVAQEG